MRTWLRLSLLIGCVFQTALAFDCSQQLKVFHADRVERLFRLWAVERDSAGRLFVRHPIRAFSFDIDGNILRGLGGVEVQDTQQGKNVFLSNEEFAIHRDAIVKLQSRYQLLPDGRSFRLYRDREDPDTFPKQVEKILGMPNYIWAGPVWAPFEDAMKSEDTRKFVALNTSRGHAADKTKLGLEKLVPQFIPATPAEDLIFTVSSDFFENEFPRVSIPDRKFIVNSGYLDLLNTIEIRGRKKGARHRFGLSDDDAPMLDDMQTRLLREVKLRRWPHIEIFTIYTSPGKVGRYHLRKSGAQKVHW